MCWFDVCETVANRTAVLGRDIATPKTPAECDKVSEQHQTAANAEYPYTSVQCHQIPHPFIRNRRVNVRVGGAIRFRSDDGTNHVGVVNAILPTRIPQQLFIVRLLLNSTGMAPDATEGMSIS
jgi:hypothetical protein